ncbi:JmjC domain-containing protein [Thiomonas sp. X19]|uniref:JmjC domain-containing protein n=1 Tax=Thiomonas sp. X19 TaxID=1050370 RepID=UPI000DD59BBF|nr:cupin domain-containing protein [Thiomonas sp. X19]
MNLLTQPAAWPLAGISLERFLQRHWQRKPLLLRQAVPGFKPLLSRAELFDLASDDAVESRLIRRQAAGKWDLKHGPFTRRSLPALRQPDWTLLVQGVDALDDAVAELLARFRFIPDARLDDVMISWASDGGGVGPHVDAYDVFLLQAEGQRRWRIGPVRTPRFEPDQPLKLLVDFVPDTDHLLDPGDMLYLPPGWGHDGVAIGPCMTYSIGFRAPPADELLRQLLWKLAEDLKPGPRYSDRGRIDTLAARAPARLPGAMVEFLQAAFVRLKPGKREFEAALGELLTEPKQLVWFDPSRQSAAQLARACARGGLRLDRRSRMLYASASVLINGERLASPLARSSLLRRLADRRQLSSQDWKGATAPEQAVLLQWCEQGWAHPSTAAEHR